MPLPTELSELQAEIDRLKARVFALEKKIEDKCDTASCPLKQKDVEISDVLDWFDLQ